MATFIYYQFNPFIEQTFPGVDAKTTFTGIFFGSINVVALSIELRPPQAVVAARLRVGWGRKGGEEDDNGVDDALGLLVSAKLEAGALHHLP